MKPISMFRGLVLHGSLARRQFVEALAGSNQDLIPQSMRLNIRFGRDAGCGPGDRLDALVRNLDLLRRHLDPDRQIRVIRADLEGDSPGSELLAELIAAVRQRFPAFVAACETTLGRSRGSEPLPPRRPVGRPQLRLVASAPAIDAFAKDSLGLGPGAESRIGGWRFEAPQAWSAYRAVMEGGEFPVASAQYITFNRRA